MDDEHILEGLHHRVDNAKRDIIKKIEDGKSFESAIIEIITDLKYSINGVSDQINEINNMIFYLKEDLKKLSDKVIE